MFVYGILNLVNLKMYVGKANDPSRRWLGHRQAAASGSKYAIHGALRKYGIEAFLFYVISSHQSEQEAYLAEKETILLYGTTTDKWGYNMTLGGEGVITTPDVRKRQSKLAILRWQNPDYGKEQADKLREKWQDPKFRQMMVALHTGKQVAKETREKESVSQKRRYKEDPARLFRNREAQRECQSRPDVVAKKAALAKENWNNPEYIEKQQEGTKRRWASEENRIAHKLKQKEICSRPEVRENMSKGQKKRYDTDEARERRNTAILLHLRGDMTLEEISRTISRCTKITRSYLLKAGFLY